MRNHVQHNLTQTHRVVSLQILLANARELRSVICHLAGRFHKGVVEQLPVTSDEKWQPHHRSLQPKHGQERNPPCCPRQPSRNPLQSPASATSSPFRPDSASLPAMTLFSPKRTFPGSSPSPIYRLFPTHCTTSF